MMSEFITTFIVLVVYHASLFTDMMVLLHGAARQMIFAYSIIDSDVLKMFCNVRMRLLRIRVG